MKIKVRNKLVEVSKFSSFYIYIYIYNAIDDANAMHAHKSIK